VNNLHDSTGGQTIVFRSPRYIVLGSVVFSLLVGMIVLVVPGGVVLALIAGVWGLVTSPQAIIALAIVLGLLDCIGAMLVWRDRCVSRIEIDHERIAFLGPLVHRRVLIDDVRLVRRRKPGQTLRPMLRVYVESSVFSRPWIALPYDDAVECFDVLREVCMHAPAIDEDDQTFEPVDSAHRRAGNQVLSRTLLGSGLALIGVGIVTGIASVVIARSLMSGGFSSSAVGGVKLAILPICSLACLVAGVVNLVRSRRHATRAKDTQSDGADGP
jgi:hypothetical protein